MKCSKSRKLDLWVLTHNFSSQKSNIFKALWAGLTNQHDISDSFAVTPLTQVL